MNFLSELHSKAREASSAYKTKVAADFAAPFKVAQRNNIYEASMKNDISRINLYHLGSTKDAHNLYYDKNSH